MDNDPCKIETFALRIPFKKGIQSDTSAWGDRNSPAADSLLVKVTTDQGLEGWGEAFGFRAVASAKLAVDDAGGAALAAGEF
jgi:L-alanine-DL-glutamate epimerase-like enolase superfamily enzyme